MGDLYYIIIDIYMRWLCVCIRAPYVRVEGHIQINQVAKKELNVGRD